MQSIGSTFSAAAIVVATDGTTARRLLELPEQDGLDPSEAQADGILLCTLVVRSPPLDVAPRGTGVLVAPGTPGITAKAVTHATAKWAWLAGNAGPGRHVLRLSYGRRGDPPPASSYFPELALTDASILFDTPLTSAELRDWTVTHWPLGAAADRTPLTVPRRLEVTGAWRSGVGLAAVVGHARAAAANVVALLAGDTSAVREV